MGAGLSSRQAGASDNVGAGTAGRQAVDGAFVRASSDDGPPQTGSKGVASQPQHALGVTRSWAARALSHTWSKGRLTEGSREKDLTRGLDLEALRQLRANYGRALIGERSAGGHVGPLIFRAPELFPWFRSRRLQGWSCAAAPLKIHRIRE